MTSDLLECQSKLTCASYLSTHRLTDVFVKNDYDRQNISYIFYRRIVHSANFVQIVFPTNVGMKGFKCGVTFQKYLLYV